MCISSNGNQLIVMTIIPELAHYIFSSQSHRFYNLLLVIRHRVEGGEVTCITETDLKFNVITKQVTGYIIVCCIVIMAGTNEQRPIITLVIPGSDKSYSM